MSRGSNNLASLNGNKWSPFLWWCCSSFYFRKRVIGFCFAVHDMVGAVGSRRGRPGKELGLWGGRRGSRRAWSWNATP